MEKSPRGWQNRRANSQIHIGIIPHINGCFKSIVLKLERNVRHNYKPLKDKRKCVHLSLPFFWVGTGATPGEELSQDRQQGQVPNALEDQEDSLSALRYALQTLKNMLIILPADVIIDTS